MIVLSPRLRLVHSQLHNKLSPRNLRVVLGKSGVITMFMPVIIFISRFPMQDTPPFEINNWTTVAYLLVGAIITAFFKSELISLLPEAIRSRLQRGGDIAKMKADIEKMQADHLMAMERLRLQYENENANALRALEREEMLMAKQEETDRQQGTDWLWREIIGSLKESLAVSHKSHEAKAAQHKDDLRIQTQKLDLIMQGHMDILGGLQGVEQSVALSVMLLAKHLGLDSVRLVDKELEETPIKRE